MHILYSVNPAFPFIHCIHCKQKLVDEYYTINFNIYIYIHKHTNIAVSAKKHAYNVIVKLVCCDDNNKITELRDVKHMVIILTDRVDVENDKIFFFLLN